MQIFWSYWKTEETAVHKGTAVIGKTGALEAWEGRSLKVTRNTQSLAALRCHENQSFESIVALNTGVKVSYNTQIRETEIQTLRVLAELGYSATAVQRC